MAKIVDTLQMIMDMDIANDESFYVCIRLCDPTCARSGYTTGIDVFDKPAVIGTQGKTTFYNCPKEQ